MTNLIDLSYFHGNISIPNLGTNEGNLDTVNDFIVKYEKKFLSELLGYKMYSQLVTAYTPTAPISGIWFDLVNGMEFVDSLGRDNLYSGLADVSEGDSNKLSPIANYIYWQFMKNSATNTSGIGETITATENAFRVSPKEKMVTAWNEMVELNIIMDDFIKQNEVKYPDYIGLTQDAFAINPPLFGNQILFKKQNTFNI